VQRTSSRSEQRCTLHAHRFLLPTPKTGLTAVCLARCSTRARQGSNLSHAPPCDCVGVRFLARRPTHVQLAIAHAFICYRCHHHIATVAIAAAACCHNQSSGCPNEALARHPTRASGGYCQGQRSRTWKPHHCHCPPTAVAHSQPRLCHFFLLSEAVLGPTSYARSLAYPSTEYRCTYVYTHSQLINRQPLLCLHPPLPSPALRREPSASTAACARAELATPLLCHLYAQ
jgi:hypothetical protein